MDLLGNFRGSSPWKFPYNFPAEIQEKWRENFLCGYFPLFSLENHRGYFHTELSLIFPSKCQSAMKGHTKGPSYEKRSQRCVNVNPLVNWKVYKFGEISLSFQPRISGEILGKVLRRNFQQFLYSLQQMIHVDKTSKFHRVLVHFLPIMDIQWILCWFFPFLGLSRGCLPHISPFSISMRQMCTISLWTTQF